jgi:hypothetical protein
MMRGSWIAVMRSRSARRGAGRLAYTADEAGFAVLGLPENGPVEYVPFPLAGPAACGDGACGKDGTDFGGAGAP